MKSQKSTGEGKKTVLTLLILLSIGSPLMATSWYSGHYELVDGNSYGEVRIYNDVTIDIYGGDISYVYAYDDTLTNWYDGEMYYFATSNNSIANIYGGTVNIGLAAVDSSIINLYAHDIVITHTGGNWDDGQVFGKYNLTDESFIFDLWGSDTYTHINTIPEPATLLLLAFGTLIIRKK